MNFERAVKIKNEFWDPKPNNASEHCFYLQREIMKLNKIWAHGIKPLEWNKKQCLPQYWDCRDHQRICHQYLLRCFYYNDTYQILSSYTDEGINLIFNSTNASFMNEYKKAITAEFYLTWSNVIIWNKFKCNVLFKSYENQ